MNFTKEEKDCLTRIHKTLNGWIKYRSYISFPFLLWFTLNMVQVMSEDKSQSMQLTDMLLLMFPLIVYYVINISESLERGIVKSNKNHIEKSLKKRLNISNDDVFKVSFNKEKLKVVIKEQNSEYNLTDII